MIVVEDSGPLLPWQLDASEHHFLETQQSGPTFLSLKFSVVTYLQERNNND